MLNQSDILRQKGNDKYNKAAESLSPVLFEAYLNEAIILYNQALNLVKNSDEIASLSKNLAMSYFKLNVKQSDIAKQLDNIYQSQKYFIQAILFVP